MSKGEVKDPKTDGRVKNAEKYQSEAELQNLEDLFEHLLQDMLYAENAIMNKGLPKMIEKASNSKLKKGFEQHLKETKDQISKLKKVFEMCDLEEKREKCDAIEGLLKEGESLIDEALSGSVLDSALIAAAQKVEHYEIASYGTLCNIAKILDHNDAAKILHEILEQEKSTDVKLSEISDGIEEDAMSHAA